MFSWIRFQQDKKPDIPSERRKYPRFKKSNLIKQLGHSSDVYRLVSNIADLSAGGLQLRSLFPYQTDELVQLVLNLGSIEKEIFMIGRIRWCSRSPECEAGYRSGISIEQMLDSDRAVYEEYLQKVAHELAA